MLRSADLKEIMSVRCTYLTEIEISLLFMLHQSTRWRDYHIHQAIQLIKSMEKKNNLISSHWEPTNIKSKSIIHDITMENFKRAQRLIMTYRFLLYGVLLAS